MDLLVNRSLTIPVSILIFIKVLTSLTRFDGGMGEVFVQLY